MLLTIAIPSHNKSYLLKEALCSIINEKEFGIEFDIIISDNSINDDIKKLYESDFNVPNISLFNSKDFDSLDANVNRSVELSTGEYVWIFGDDDLLIPGVIRNILNFLKLKEPNLLILNSQSFRDENIIEYSRLPSTIKDIYLENHNDEFLTDLGGYLTFVGAILVKRKLWMDNYDKSKIGSFFAHIDCLASLKNNRVVYYSSTPALKMRLGSQTWLDKSFQIWYLLYPSIIWGLENYSNFAKKQVISRNPLNSIKSMVAARAYGRINYQIYKKYLFLSEKVSLLNKILLFFVVMIPVKVFKLIYIIYIKFLKTNHNSKFSPKLALAQLKININ